VGVPDMEEGGASGPAETVRPHARRLSQLALPGEPPSHQKSGQDGKVEGTGSMLDVAVAGRNGGIRSAQTFRIVPGS
jgi:hypothetical protein